MVMTNRKMEMAEAERNLKSMNLKFVEAST